MVISKNIPLKDYTNYKTGGNALYFADCKKDSDVLSALEFAVSHELKYEVIGGGSNLLVSDNGYNGIIICTRNLNRYIINNGNIVKCGAGIALAELVLYACQKGLGGMEAMAGIPGSTGGACKMNAGAFGQEIKDTLINAKVMDNKGKINTLKNEDIGFGYRVSRAFDGKIVLEASFSYKRDKTSDELLNIRHEILEKRKEKQPLHKPSCGSVFKRPEGNYAGTLIEKCGLKGYTIGGAMVSTKHANFILNENNATSSDIYNLINHVKDTVYNQTGIKLEPEVRLIGFDD